MEKVKLEEFNHWWIKGKVDSELALPFKRDSYKEIEKYIDKKFIVAITGLRRVGKTTTIYQLIQNLIDKKVNTENILFFSFDENILKIGEVIEIYKEIHKKDFREEKIYIFLDEIQKLENWENEIKKYYDLYPKLKFIISGSESLFIKKKTKETLAGRIFEFNLSTFTFREYLKINKIKEFKYETKIKPFLLKYIEKGGFPETFSFESDKEFKEYIRALVVDKIVYKDIPKIFKLDDPEFLSILLELIAANPGMYIDYFSLSKQFNKDRRVIKNYLFYLKESFLINILGNYRKGSTTLRKRKRAYPTDNALIYLYKPKIEEDFFGKMAETAVVNNLKAVSFWKNGNEVDVVHNNMPIEVKYQEKIKPEDLKSIIEFMKRFKVKNGMLITKNEEKEIKVKEGKIKFIPLWKWLLENKA
ncbi:ATP-binding protein [Candidatus Woesearchaeota archaeon]|nr:ATP-binding protein [Candidatus Woesearchaeota archaeon]